MPWKEAIKEADEGEEISAVEEMFKSELPLHLTGLEGILLNPPWTSSPTFTEDFLNWFQLPLTMLHDGIVFIWVRKQSIFQVIKSFEKQGLIYIENLCWVMLDPQFHDKS